jgi:hypothetical protein
VVSIVRNPYSRFLSSYEFRWWAKNPALDAKILSEQLPQFPVLSIDDYVRYSELKLIHGRLNNVRPKAQIGNQTAQFIQMFFKNPQSVLDNITDEYIESDLVFDDMANITFLRQENLKKDLATFLLGKGFTQDEINYMEKRERVNVTKKTTPVRRQLWTQKALEYVSQKDRLIFRILKSQGIYYEKPMITEENFTNNS